MSEKIKNLWAIQLENNYYQLPKNVFGNIFVVSIIMVVFYVTGNKGRDFGGYLILILLLLVFMAPITWYLMRYHFSKPIRVIAVMFYNQITVLIISLTIMLFSYDEFSHSGSEYLLTPILVIYMISNIMFAIYLLIRKPFFEDAIFSKEFWGSTQMRYFSFGGLAATVAYLLYAIFQATQISGNIFMGYVLALVSLVFSGITVYRFCNILILLYHGLDKSGMK